MTPEILAVLGGGVAGFIFRLIAVLIEGQQKALAMQIERNNAADASADKAAKRTGKAGEWVRRLIVICVLFAVIVAPFVVSYTGQGVTVEREQMKGILGYLANLIGVNRGGYETVSGYLILPEVRQCVLAIIGFYFGSSRFRG